MRGALRPRGALPGLELHLPDRRPGGDLLAQERGAAPRRGRRRRLRRARRRRHRAAGAQPRVRDRPPRRRLPLGRRCRRRGTARPAGSPASGTASAAPGPTCGRAIRNPGPPAAFSRTTSPRPVTGHAASRASSDDADLMNRRRRSTLQSRGHLQRTHRGNAARRPRSGRIRRQPVQSDDPARHHRAVAGGQDRVHHRAGARPRPRRPVSRCSRRRTRGASSTRISRRSRTTRCRASTMRAISMRCSPTASGRSRRGRSANCGS